MELCINSTKSLPDNTKPLIETLSLPVPISENMSQSIEQYVNTASFDVLTAKMINLQRRNKTATQYTKEIEELAKGIHSAYISDGVPSKIAKQYTTTSVVNAITKNAALPEIKVIMKTGNFNDINQAVSKFAECCTDQTNRADVALHYRQANNYQRGSNYYQNNMRGNRRCQYQFRGRGGYNNRNYYDQGYNITNNNNI